MSFGKVRIEVHTPQAAMVWLPPRSACPSENNAIATPPVLIVRQHTYSHSFVLSADARKAGDFFPEMLANAMRPIKSVSPAVS